MCFLFAQYVSFLVYGRMVFRYAKCEGDFVGNVYAQILYDSQVCRSW
jgi:hypothetical protein